MSKFFSFSRNQGVVMVTLLFVVLLGAIYFFMYIPNNQRNLEEQRFRCLQNIETNIHAKIDNSVALLNNLLITWQKNDKQYNRERLKQYIKNYPQQNFTLIPISTAKNTPDKTVEDSTCNIDFNKQDLIIYLRKNGYQIGLKYSINQFIDPLLPRDIYNEYILLKSSKIVYQTFPSGITTITTDSLKTDKSAFAGEQVKNIALSGTQYKLFSQQLSLNADSVLTITGLLKDQNYQHEKNKLQENVVLLLLILAIATILALPWIKLYQMGNQDRLTVADGLFSFAVSMLLMSLLFFAFFKYNVLLRPGENVSQKIGKNLASELEKSFVNETNSAYKLLTRLDQVRDNNKTAAAFINFSDKSINYKYQGSDTTSQTGKFAYKIDSIARGININQIFWLKNNGSESNNWSAAANIAPPGNFANRNYFTNLQNKSSYFLPLPNKQPYYLDQVISWTTGQFTSIISKPSVNKGTPVVAMSFNFKCLSKPILPSGFLFAIINNEGKVLYHSNASKNLNENLLNEFSEKEKLKTAVLTHGNAFFYTQYLGREYYATVKSISNLPYQIVVFEDKDYKNIRDINVFSFSFVMLFSFFLLLIIQILAVFGFSQKTSFFKKHYFDISWIGPNKNFAHQYNLAIVYNAINILLLLIFFKYSSFLQFLFILFVSSTSVTLFLNYNYSKSYYNTFTEKFKLKRTANIALIVVIVLVNIAALIIIEPYKFFGFEIILILTVIALLNISERAFEWANRFRFFPKNNWSFSSSYSLMIFTRLIITSGLPVMLFFTASYNYELKMTTRYRHLQFTKELLDKYPTLKKDLKFKDVYIDSVWIRDIKNTTEIPQLKISDEEKNTTTLFKYLTNYTTKQLPDIDQYNPNPTESFMMFSPLFQPGKTESYHKLANGKYIQLTSLKIQYISPATYNNDKWYLGIIYWVLFLSALLVFGMVLHNIFKKLFALNLPATKGWQEIDELLLTDNELNSLLFVIGSPGSGKLSRFKKLISDKKIKGKCDVELIMEQSNTASNNVFIADMILIPENAEEAKTDQNWLDMQDAALNKDYALVIVNHFEYDIKNPSTNAAKLNFMEALLQRNRSKIVIISTVHPVNFLDSLNQQELYKVEDNRQPEHDLERWHVLLGHFRIIIEKLQTAAINIDAKAPLWKKILMMETQSGHFLKKMQQPLTTCIDELPADELALVDGDSLAFKMQITSHYFYMYLWQSLTKEEKFLLYDLAEDGLVNPYDDYNLTLLISKGIITKEDGILRLFNKGFRNFILTAIGNSEAMKIRNQIKDNGNWKNLKTPLMILAVAILAFLFTSQQEAYATIIKYLTILSVGVPAILKFFSMFSGDKTEKS
ncbi:cache domain-containing protein [Pedobacter aquatilis]|uniref:PDC sensor domain-containing protein n=1 Tax=Pedobacter aquatilis TaxID=351343 RepID=UPI0029318253|nr:cache domain-containing protein [Pedobacter aquatilis]